MDVVGSITRSTRGSNNRWSIFTFEILDRGFLSSDAGETALTCQILNISLFRGLQGLTFTDLLAK